MSIYQQRTSEFDERVIVISFPGQAGIKDVNEAIRDQIASNHYYLVIDWGNISQIDYPALGELIGLKGDLKNLTGDFMIFNLKRNIQQHFSLIGLTNILSINDTEHEAVNRFQWQLNFESETMLIHFPNSMDYVPGMRQLVSQIASMRGFSKKDAYRIETIVDELCNNAIEHGSVHQRAQIVMKCMFDKEKLDLTIIDSGHLQNDPGHIEKLMKRAQSAMTSSSETRGRGLPIVSMLADHINFSIENGGTAVHIQKYKNRLNSDD